MDHVTVDFGQERSIHLKKSIQRPTKMHTASGIGEEKVYQILAIKIKRQRILLAHC